MEYSRARGTDRLVLFALAEHADSDGRAWPSVETIGIYAGADRRSVQRSLRYLCDQGEITLLVKGGGRNNPARYMISLPANKQRSNSHPLSPPKQRSLLAGLAHKNGKTLQQSKTAVNQPPEVLRHAQGSIRANGNGAHHPSDSERSPFLQDPDQ